MSGETEQQVSGWTVDTLRYHQQVVDSWRDRVEAERDRRYSEVALEREKALKIKETADLAALQLAREIQTYKDEKANELREQIGSERGLYVTKAELKPIADFVVSQTARGQGLAANWGVLVTVITVALMIATLIVTRG